MNDITMGRIQLATEQTRKYLTDSNLGECRITVPHYVKVTDTQKINITFTGNMSSQNLMDITKIWFWNLNTDSSSCTSYTPETKTLHITLMHCVASSNVYAKLCELGATMHSFCADAVSFTFEASPKGRVDFLSEALDELRAIVDPAHTNDFPIYQIVKEKIASLRIYPCFE